MKTYMRPVEYQMDARAADSYLKARKGDDKKLRPNDYLCKVVNEEYNLRGYCVKVTTV